MEFLPAGSFRQYAASVLWVEDEEPEVVGSCSICHEDVFMGHEVIERGVLSHIDCEPEVA